MTPSWANNAIFYHLYPLGCTGAPTQNQPNQNTSYRLETLLPWLDHIKSLGMNSLYLGPVFQSTSHGYDTIDYFQVDRRLGDNDSLTRFSEAVHEKGMRLVLDAVFNHVGRDFWAFKDVLANKERSAYKDWFQGLTFQGSSPYGDPFQYEGWQGHHSLVKLNLANPDVRSHLFDAVRMWIENFNIDGLRLDAADCIDINFLKDLGQFTREQRSDFWLLGEVVHGDYRKWANPETLDSVTNYEIYKGLYSSFNDRNFHEIAYSLNRQLSEAGLYRDLWLYNFVDNHDVERIASRLKNKTHLYPLYILLFTIPGIPSVYYGSEWGIEGSKMAYSDAALRPALSLPRMQANPPHPNLPQVLQQLSQIRSQSEALSFGSYSQLYVNQEQLVFLREFENQKAVIIINGASQPAPLEINVPLGETRMRDYLNSGETFHVHGGRLQLVLPPTWGRILIPS